MRHIVKKNISGNEYYYFQLKLASIDPKKEPYLYSKYIGEYLPSESVLKNFLMKRAEDLAIITASNLGKGIRTYFRNGPDIKEVERDRWWFYFINNYDLFEDQNSTYQSLFAILFTLHTNVIEGSKMRQDDIIAMTSDSRKKVVTFEEKEVTNTLDALKFSVSNEMKWNVSSIKKLHSKILPDDPLAGKFRIREVEVGDATRTRLYNTVEPQKIRKELRELLYWFNREHNKVYPPQLALEFHWRFERIHPFQDGNGRVGRLLLNRILIEHHFMPVIFFSENVRQYYDAIAQARNGNSSKLATFFLRQNKKTKEAMERFKREGIVSGRRSRIGRWTIKRGKTPKEYDVEAEE
ncbi:MAG: Fic family protein [archaeon]